jgi:hypothetical protein
MDLNCVGREDVDWINLNRDRVQCWMLVNNIPDIRDQYTRNFTSSATNSFSRRTLLHEVKTIVSLI